LRAQAGIPAASFEIVEINPNTTSPADDSAAHFLIIVALSFSVATDVARTRGDRGDISKGSVPRRAPELLRR
jgi:hypothetical protein